MSAAMYAKMGNKAIGAVSDHLLASTQRKMQADAQEHRNTMSAISASMQRNNVTQAEINTQDNARRLKQQIDLTSMQDKGNAEVSAAASGVAGGSVANTMRGLQRSAMQANYARIRNVDSQMQAHGQNRKNVTLQQIYNKDAQVFQKPSVSTALLGLTTSLVDTYNKNQPQGQGLASTASKLLGGTGSP